MGVDKILVDEFFFPLDFSCLLAIIGGLMGCYVRHYEGSKLKPVLDLARLFNTLKKGLPRDWRYLFSMQ